MTADRPPSPFETARADLRAIGIDLTMRRGTYCVNFRTGGMDAMAYFTDDLADAIEHGRAMAASAFGQAIADLQMNENIAPSNNERHPHPVGNENIAPSNNERHPHPVGGVIVGGGGLCIAALGALLLYDTRCQHIGIGDVFTTNQCQSEIFFGKAMIVIGLFIALAGFVLNILIKRSLTRVD